MLSLHRDKHCNSSACETKINLSHFISGGQLKLSRPAGLLPIGKLHTRDLHGFRTGSTAASRQSRIFLKCRKIPRETGNPHGNAPLQHAIRRRRLSLRPALAGGPSAPLRNDWRSSKHAKLPRPWSKKKNPSKTFPAPAAAERNTHFFFLPSINT